MPFEGISKTLTSLWQKKAKVSFAKQLTRIVKDEVTRGNKPANPKDIKSAGDALGKLDTLVAKASKTGEAKDLNPVLTMAGTCETALDKLILVATGEYLADLKALRKEIDTANGIGATARDVQSATGMAAQIRQENQAKVRAATLKMNTISKAVDAAIQRADTLAKDIKVAVKPKDIDLLVSRYNKMQKEFDDLQEQWNAAFTEIGELAA
jgi:hypothetical protein